MKLFGKKKETKSCCCGGNCTSETMKNAENKKQEQGIKILGSGCAKCMELEKATRTAISELQLDYEIEHITDFAEIASYGCIFRKNCASVPEERSAIPLQTEQSSAG